MKSIGIEKSDKGLPICDEISDKFCEALWNKSKRGNWIFDKDSKILTGDVVLGVISWAEYIHWTKWIQNKCDLPKELKSLLKPHCGWRSVSLRSGPIEQMDKLLKNLAQVKQNYVSKKDWKQNFVLLKAEFEAYMEKAGLIRAISVDSSISQLENFNFSLVQEQLILKSRFEITNEVLDLFYLKSKDWKRVLQIFEEAKSDVLSVVQGLEIDDSLKSDLEARVSGVKISLPYLDYDMDDEGLDCWRSEINAGYIVSLNTLYVCAGKIESIQVEGGLYGTIAHEIGHSIDPEGLGWERFKNSEIQKQSSRVFKENGRMDCEEWESIKRNVFEAKMSFQEYPKTIHKLYSCLVDISDLYEMNMANVLQASKNISENNISSYANYSYFSRLLTKEYLGVYEGVKNPYYLDPRALSGLSRAGYAENFFERYDFYIPAIFTQEYLCARQKDTGKGEEDIFEGAIEATKILRKLYLANKYTYFQQSDPAFKSQGLSKEVGEDVADWISQKALAFYLKRLDSKYKKNLAILGRSVTFCDSVVTARQVSRYQNIEQQIGILAHPVNRKRRLRLFSTEVARQLGCTPGKDSVEYTNSCDEGVYSPAIYQQHNP